MIRMLLILGVFLASIQAAGARTLADAAALYNRGAMRQAATLARTLGGASGFSLAAKATLVQAVYLASTREKVVLFQRAAYDARAALALAPDNVDALLQLAIALGYLGDLEDPLTAHLHGYAKEGRALLDRVLALDPGNTWAKALLGIWHLKLVERAGDALAGGLYHASRQEGLERCLDTMAGPLRDLALKYGCAVALFELDPKDFTSVARQTLASVTRAAPRDAADRLLQSEAARLLDEIKSGGSP